ncbi:MAG: dihydrodipicolinate synthase family protein [Myxococcota bacterium]
MTSPQLLVATVTPFTADNHIDYTLLDQHVRWLERCGVDGVVPTGTTGGFLYLTTHEKRAIHRAVIGVTRNARVIPCVWDPQRKETLFLARQAAVDGAWGVISPPPLYHRVCEAAIVEWYAAIVDAVKIPVLAYHHPRTGNPLSIALIRKLIDDVGCWGVKDSSKDPERVRILSDAYPERVYVGGDNFLGQAEALGPIAGHVSGFANVYPESAVRGIRGTIPRDALLAAMNAVRAAGGPPAMAARLGMKHRPPLHIFDADAVAALSKPSFTPLGGLL